MQLHPFHCKDGKSLRPTWVKSKTSEIANIFFSYSKKYSAQFHFKSIFVEILNRKKQRHFHKQNKSRRTSAEKNLKLNE